MTESPGFEAARRSWLDDPAVIRSKSIDATSEKPSIRHVESCAERAVVSHEPPARRPKVEHGESAQKRFPVLRLSKALLVGVQQVDGRGFVVAAAPAAEAIQAGERRRVVDRMRRHSPLRRSLLASEVAEVDSLLPTYASGSLREYHPIDRRRK
jgi:hypothetical protein